MMIRLTVTPQKIELWLRADLILSIERSRANILETIVITSLNTSKGPVMYSVLESPEEIAKAINLALNPPKGYLE